MKNTAIHNTGKAIKKTDVQKKGTFPQKFGPVLITRPLLLLVIIAMVIYLPTLSFGFTELDDSIFIKEFHQYNSDISHLFTSFKRGLFDAVKDPYYRPMFLDSMILNNMLGAGEHILGYHIGNILLHMLSVGMLFRVLERLNLRKLDAFLVCILFAVHPILSQAVTWIPGRNDTLLAVFSFGFLASAIDFVNMGKPKDVLISGIFLLLAFFTKETAVLLPVVAAVLLWYMLRNKPFSSQGIISMIVWAACFAVWYTVRSQSPNIQNNHLAAGVMATDFVHRLPLLIQYIGKIFIPVNQSVFPMQEDTTYVYGLLAIALLGAMLFFSKNVNKRQVIAGFVVFFLFLIPALLVPNNLNEQTFEHRLYLPMLGILLVMPETVMFKKLDDGNLLFYTSIIATLLAISNFVYQRNFTDPVTFWTQAVETSPHSAYAKMMLGAREDNMEESYRLFRESYKLDPKQKYINYYYGRMLQMKDSVLASEPYLLREKSISNFPEVDFHLARVAIMKGDTNGAISYLEAYLEKNPDNEPAHNNLLVTYLGKKEFDKARKHAEQMRRNGLKVPDEIARILAAPVPVAPTPQPTADTLRNK